MESGGRDSLTKFHKEKEFFALMESEIQRAKRYQRPFGLLVIDFQANPADQKSYSHYPVLRQCSKVIRELIRSADIPARIGDKFALGIPESDRDKAEKMAVRILGELGNVEILEDGLSLHVSGRVGIAVYPDDGGTGKALMNAAEKSLLSTPLRS